MKPGGEEDLEGRKTFQDPRLVEGPRWTNDLTPIAGPYWAVYDNSGWMRGSANTEAGAKRLKKDAEEGRLATPILYPPHYDE